MSAELTSSLAASIGASGTGSLAIFPTAPIIFAVLPPTGPAAGGNQVVIFGLGFTGATSVNFGGNPATSYTVVGNNLIIAVAPAGSGTVPVTVTTPSGTSNSFPYSYITAPAPVIAAVVPPTGPSTGGNLVTITGTGFTGATSVNFGGNPATSYTVVSNNLIIAVAPAGSGTVPVTVTTPSGTSNSFPYSYITAPAPVIAAVVPPTGPSTGGNLVTITGTGFTGATSVNFGGNPATSYTVVSDSLIIAIAPAGVGTVQVTVTTPNGTSNSFPYIYV
ncbi:IPT/TIG domain-containing protein [Streptomyces sp. NPDC004647]|uniref:IPT/TIG domain-containing protein n=1 Tax=Streptomyces sp. NPDC004647 TaxID=3154671 RepID=UPI0033AE0B37